MEQTLIKKRDNFKAEIRREALSKIMSLKRVQPKLIESNQDAVFIFIIFSSRCYLTGWQ